MTTARWNKGRALHYPRLAEVSTVTFQGARIDAAGCTDTGKVRRRNEDQFLIASLHRMVKVEATSVPLPGRRRFGRGAQALLLLVADGVGGGPGGDEASARALDTIVQYVAGASALFGQQEDGSGPDLLRELTLAVQWGHAALRDRAGEEPGLAGMATTLTMAHVRWPKAHVVQVGDSRCYHLGASGLRRVTRDQTMAQQLIDQGALPPAAAERSPLSHVLAQAVGHSEPEVRPESSEVELARGDVLLLCTDGLTKHVADAEIATLVEAADSAERACAALVGAALGAGGSDNVTVVLTRFS